MLKNPLMESLRKGLTKEEQAQIDDSFALADRIAYLLKKHEITQRQLAERLGKRESEVSKWLSGSHNFTQSTLTKISCAIGESIYVIPRIKPNTNLYKNNDLSLHSTLKATIVRCFKEISYLSKDKFEPYPKELSRFEINTHGVICNHHPKSEDKFDTVKLDPAKFKHIEKETSVW